MAGGKVQNDAENARNLKLGGHVGFDSLPNQLVNKSLNNGFCFNILSIGETGIGELRVIFSNLWFH